MSTSRVSLQPTNAAAATMQAARADYNASKAHAAAALSGTNKGGPNIQASAQNATRAYSNVPDGEHMIFSARRDGGMDINVIPLKGQPQQFSLSPEQYNQFLHGQGGQFDNLMNQDVKQVLSQIQQSRGRAIQTAQAGGAAPTAQVTGSPGAPNPPAPPPAAAPAPAIGEPSGPQGPINVVRFGVPHTEGGPQTGADAFKQFQPQDVAAAQSQFPGDVGKQVAWLYQQKQEAAKLANAVTVAQNQRLYGTQATAQERFAASQNAATSRENAARIKGQYDVLAKQAGTENGVLASQAKMLSTMLANGVDVDTVNKQAQKWGIDWQKINAQAQQQNAAQQAPGQQGAAPKRVINGVTYTKSQADGKWYKQTTPAAQ